MLYYGKKENKKIISASEKDSIIVGVCAGIADYFKIDPVLVRLLWVLFVFGFGTGILAYLLAWIIIPRK